MANQYNSRPRPASIVLEDGDVRLARRRETVDDVTRAEREARSAPSADRKNDHGRASDIDND